MSAFDPERFEKELRRLRPAKPPEDLVHRLAERVAVAEPSQSSPVTFRSFSSWWARLGWAAAAATALVIITAWVAYKAHRMPLHDQVQVARKPVEAPMKADQVEINQRLVAAFDAVAQMPDGAPVRLRCREWVDAVVLRDSARGVVVERETPRLEVVPVRFETY